MLNVLGNGHTLVGMVGEISLDFLWVLDDSDGGLSSFSFQMVDLTSGVGGVGGLGDNSGGSHGVGLGSSHNSDWVFGSDGLDLTFVMLVGLSDGGDGSGGSVNVSEVGAGDVSTLTVFDLVDDTFGVNVFSSDNSGNSRGNSSEQMLHVEGGLLLVNNWLVVVDNDGFSVNNWFAVNIDGLLVVDDFFSLSWEEIAHEVSEDIAIWGNLFQKGSTSESLLFVDLEEVLNDIAQQGVAVSISFSEFVEMSLKMLFVDLVVLLINVLDAFVDSATENDHTEAERIVLLSIEVQVLVLKSFIDLWGHEKILTSGHVVKSSLLGGASLGKSVDEVVSLGFIGVDVLVHSEVLGSKVIVVSSVLVEEAKSFKSLVSDVGELLVGEDDSAISFLVSVTGQRLKVVVGKFVVSSNGIVLGAEVLLVTGAVIDHFHEAIVVEGHSSSGGKDVLGGVLFRVRDFLLEKDSVTSLLVLEDLDVAESLVVILFNDLVLGFDD